MISAYPGDRRSASSQSPGKTPAAIRPRNDGEAERAAIARAEAALRELAGNFTDWMAEECQRLDACFVKWRRDPLDLGNRSSFYFAVHDVASGSETLGFPLASRIGESLRRLLDNVDQPDTYCVEQYVAAICAISRDKITTADPVALELVGELEKLTRRLMDDEAKSTNEVFI